MQRTTKFGILMLVMAFAIAIGRLALKTDQPEPSYQGKPVSYWLTDGFTFSPSVDDRPPAESAFRCLGANAVPFLIATLGRTDGPLKQIYLRCYPKLPAKLRTQLPRPASADALRGRAILSLRIIGPAAKAAIPSLLNVLTNDPGAMRRANAVVCLDTIDGGHLQTEVVDAWLRVRSDPDPVVARMATEVLRRHFPLGVLEIKDGEISLVRGGDVYEKVHKK